MTDQQAHTPGPWRVGERQSYFGVYADIDMPGNRGQVATCTKPLKNAEANAHLIAASPQMLGALKAALPHLDNSGSPGGCDGTQYECDHCAAIRLVRAAIKNAEGVTEGASATGIK